MAEETETLSATPSPEAASAEEPQAGRGITIPAILTGLGLLLLLAVNLPYWSLSKNYPLGMGGYLPVEALILTLAILVFNRFRGVFAMVAGILAVTIVAPVWHAAVYARTDAMIYALSPASHALRLLFRGSIETAQKSQGRPALLVALGGLLVFAAAAGLGYLISVAVPALRRRFHWREIAVIFTLLMVGLYSCKSVQWMVGITVVPYKDDDKARNFKGRLLQPVPAHQMKIEDPRILEALARLKGDPGAIESIGLFRDYRTLATLRALEKLKADSQDEAARRALREKVWGPEGRAALAALKAFENSPATLRKALAKSCENARRGIYSNAHREALLRVRSYNAPGVPDFLVAYNPHKFDASTTEGRQEQDIEKKELEKYSKGYGKRAPPTPKMPLPVPPPRPAPPTRGDYADPAEYQQELAQYEKDLAEHEKDLVQYRKDHEEYLKAYRRYQKRLTEDRAREWRTFWRRWKGPLKWWVPLLILVLLLQVFLAGILRRQWCDHEKLMFPHIEAVRSLVEGEEVGARVRRVLSSRLLWIGMGLSIVLFTFQGLNAYFPGQVPAPNLHQLDMQTFIGERPWQAMYRYLNIQPFLVGIAYLLTCEVSLSIWFFALVNQGLCVACSAWGIRERDAWMIHGEWINSDALYTGAMVIFVLWLMWGGRRHIWYVLRRGLKLAPADEIEKSAPMNQAVAFWGFWLSLAGIMVWCLLVGLKLWIMAVIFGVYIILLLLVCRVVSEAGVLTAGIGVWPFYPHFVHCHLFGLGRDSLFAKTLAYKDSWLTPIGESGGKSVPAALRNYGVFSFIWPSILFHLQLTPFMLAGFKLTETEPRRKRLLTLLMVGGMLVATFIFLNATMNFIFERGANDTKVYGFHCWSWVFKNWTIRDVIIRERMWSPDTFRMSMMSLGGLVMGLLLVLRSTFYWWPLHPIGMVTTGVESGVWSAFLLGWLFKRTALSYGGGEFSQKVNPFFYGVIIGQFLMGAFWALVGLCGSEVIPTYVLRGMSY